MLGSYLYFLCSTIMVQNSMPKISMNMREAAIVSRVVDMLRHNIEAQRREVGFVEALTADDGQRVWDEEFGPTMRKMFNMDRNDFLQNFWPPIQSYLNTSYHLQ